MKKYKTINITWNDLKKIPAEFSGSFVYRDFWCDSNDIVYLNNSPRIVAESYDCYDNDLSSLDAISLIIGEEIGYYTLSLRFD